MRAIVRKKRRFAKGTKKRRANQADIAASTSRRAVSATPTAMKGTAARARARK
jgi:hypothetical protein